VTKEYVKIADESNVRARCRKAQRSTSAADVVQRGQMMARALFKYRCERGRQLLHTAARDAIAQRHTGTHCE